MLKAPVWLDCDPGHDDVLALLLAAFSPKLELLGVSTVHGNASIEDTTANAARSLVAFNAPESVHVHPGRACGILRSTATYASSVHGTDGLGGVRGLPDASDPRVQQRVLDATTHSAVEGIRTACLQVLKREDRLTLLVTGAMSNVAAFILAYPELSQKALRQVLFMGGALEEPGNSNSHRSAEWNVYADPEAVHVALVNCPCPIVFFPLDVTHKALFRNDIELVRLNNKRTNHRLVIETAVDFFRGTYASLFGFTSPPCHDVLTSAFAIRPDLFTLQQARLTVETLDDDHRGKLVRCEGEQQGTLVQVAMDVDIAGMWDLFFDALEKSEASVSSD